MGVVEATTTPGGRARLVWPWPGLTISAVEYQFDPRHETRSTRGSHTHLTHVSPGGCHCNVNRPNGYKFSFRLIQKLSFHSQHKSADNSAKSEQQFGKK